MKEKFILELELRYRIVKNNDERYVNPKVLIGIYDSWDEAERKGNEIIRNVLSKHFEVRNDDYFERNYLFGRPNNLVTNCCYHKGRPQYFFHILKRPVYEDIEQFITTAINDYEAYKQWNRTRDEEDD